MRCEDCGACTWVPQTEMAHHLKPATRAQIQSVISFIQERGKDQILGFYDLQISMKNWKK